MLLGFFSDLDETMSMSYPKKVFQNESLSFLMYKAALFGVQKLVNVLITYVEER